MVLIVSLISLIRLVPNATQPWTSPRLARPRTSVSLAPRSPSLVPGELAERQHRIRRWRAYRRGESTLFFKQTMDDAFSSLLSSGLTPSAIRSTLLNLCIDLTITAHPTQATRKTLLGKYYGIAEGLTMRDTMVLTPDEGERVREGVVREVLGVWGSSAVRRVKPKPEVRGCEPSEQGSGDSGLTPFFYFWARSDATPRHLASLG